jgi:hypothetical protein
MHWHAYVSVYVGQKKLESDLESSLLRQSLSVFLINRLSLSL